MKGKVVEWLHLLPTLERIKGLEKEAAKFFYESLNDEQKTVLGKLSTTGGIWRLQEIISMEKDATRRREEH